MAISCTSEKEMGTDKEDKTSLIQENGMLILPDYRAWHVGKFYYREKPTGTFLINRTDSIQEEFIKSTGMIVEFDIHWISDSSYTLSYNHISENPNQGVIADGIDSLVKTCSITRMTDWHYVEEATSNLSDDTIRTRIYRYL